MLAVAIKNKCPEKLGKYCSLEVKFMFRVVVSLAFMLLFLVIHPFLASAQERVRVGWAAMTASHTPLWVAQEKGFAAKQGLSLESIFFGAGPPAMQALVAGDLDIVITSAPNVVNPRLGGADTVMILSIIPTFIDHIISAPNITTPEQLRGKIGSVKSLRQYLGYGAAAFTAAAGHRSGEGREDCPRWRQPRATRGHFKKHLTVYHHERAFHHKKPNASVSVI
jgi:NMT1-like family